MDTVALKDTLQTNSNGERAPTFLFNRKVGQDEKQLHLESRGTLKQGVENTKSPIEEPKVSMSTCRGWTQRVFPYQSLKHQSMGQCRVHSRLTRQWDGQESECYPHLALQELI